MKPKLLYFLFLITSLVGIFILVKTWIPEGYVVAGHDSGFAVDTKEFLVSRLSAWSQQNFGQDNSPHFGSIIMHTIDFLVGNRFSLFLWLSLIFASSFVFAYFLRDELGDTFPLIFPVISTFNFFIIQSLFIIERAKYSIYVACMLIGLIIFRLVKNKISLIAAVLLSTLVLFIFNGGSWLGMPLYGSLIVLILGFLMAELIKGAKDHNFDGVKKYLTYLVFTFITFVAVSAYSIFPYASTFIRQDFSRVTDRAVVDQNKDWLRSISQSGSFSNFFRLQGVPDWYASSYKPNEGHAYAMDYLENPNYIIPSFVFSILMFLAFIFAKDKKEGRTVSIFGIFVVLSMFFMAGSHKPLGPVYEFIYTYVPGFSIFRSPYFKFASVFFIGAAGLIAYALTKIFERLGTIKFILTILFIGLWFTYHNVLFQPTKIFEWQPGLSTRFELPDYISDFDRWIGQNKIDGRVLLIPPNNEQWKNDAYKWGYWSLTNLPSSLSNTPFLVNDSLLLRGQNIWVNALYNAIESGDEDNFTNLSRRLGVSHLLLRGDVLTNSEWSSSSDPNVYKTNIGKFDGVSILEDFGEWSIYKLTSPDPKIFTTSKIFSISKDSLGIVPLLRGEFVFREDVNLNPELKNYLSGEILTFNCSSCILESRSLNSNLPSVRLLPDSRLYFLKEARDKKLLEQVIDPGQRIFSDLGISLRRSAETIAMIERGSNERYIIDNLDRTNFYLEETLHILEGGVGNKNDYQQIRSIMDSLNPIEVSFRDRISRNDFGVKGEELRRKFHSVLWFIYQIKDFYKSTTDQVTDSNRKIFDLSFNAGGEYVVEASAATLPSDKTGKAIYPKEIVYTSNDSEIRFKSFPIKLSVSDNQKGRLVLDFGILPNLFESLGSSFLRFPVGEKGCLKGRIQSYNPQSSYSVKLSVDANSNQKFNFIILSNHLDTDSQKSFLNSEVEFGLDPTSFGDTFNYLYEPKGAVDPTIMICDQGGSLPKLTTIEVYEIASPSLIAYLGEYTLNSQTERKPLLIEKISSTKYRAKVEVDSANNILVFNESFNSGWRVKDLDSGTYLAESNQFLINGYANAWQLAGKGVKNVEIEYMPQRNFGIGVGVSIFSLLTLVVLYILIRKYK